METVRFRAMNTDILLAGEGKSEDLAAGFEKTEAFIHASEDRFTRFSAASELTALNRSAGTLFCASPDLFSVVALSRRFFHLTRGLFDPSILPDLKQAGYNRSMDLIRKDGPAPLLESLLTAERPSLSEMDLDETDHSIFMPVGMAIDLGGIAKGWIAEKAANLLSNYTSACGVDAGGDMFLVGVPQGSEQWNIELEDPMEHDAVLTTFEVDPGGVATSTVTKRNWMLDGKTQHHIIDPRTGEPAVSDWISVTVVAPHAYEAEVFAKALLIAGPDESREITSNSSIPIAYLAVDQEKKIWGNQEIMELSYVDYASVQ